MIHVIVNAAWQVQELGADEVVDYTKQTVDQVYKTNPFDAVIDQIGGVLHESHSMLHFVACLIFDKP